MKKILFSALAVLSLAACVQEAVVDTPQGDAIAFENAFVDNATRATLTKDDLKAFSVWGFINNSNSVLFEGTKVSGSGNTWRYDGTKYWIPGQDYYFAALAPLTENGSVINAVVDPANGDDAKLGLGTVEFTNDGETDLIYAEAYQKGKQSGNAAVAFTFKHLLSKVKFTFTTMMGMDAERITAEVTNIEMTAPKKAEINLASATPVWGEYSESVVLDFGAATDKKELFAIPTAAYDYLITFTVTIKQDGNPILVVEKASTVNDLALEMGKAYNFTAVINPETLNLEDVVFNVGGVEDWDENNPEVDFAPATPVATPEALGQALTDGAESVVLTGDITIDALMATTKGVNDAGLTIGHSIVIDGNGHTLTYKGSNRAITVEYSETNVDLTLKNVNLVLENNYCQRAINYNNGGILTLDNVNISKSGTAATYALNLPGSSDDCNVIINDSYLRGNIALNVWGENANICAENTTFVSYDNSTAEGYAAVNLNNDGTTVANGTIININGGKIIAHDEKGNPSYAISNNTITGEIIVSAETEVVGNIRTNVAIVDYGATEFYSCETLQEAIDKAAESNADKVKLIRDVELSAPVVVAEGKTVTLDLNGKTINATYEREGRHYYAILNHGTLEIKGTGAIKARGTKNFGTMTVNGDITITNVDTDGGAAIWNEGTVEINAGTFTTNSTAGAGSYGAALNTRAGGTAVVNGGNFSAYSQLTYAIVNEGNTTINNATVAGKHGAVAGSETSNTVINGGSFSLMENPGVSDHCAYFVSEIKGGTFTLGNNTDCGAQVFYESNIADGYNAIEINTNEYTVVHGTPVSNADELVTALGKGECVTFMNDITIAATNGGYDKAGILQNKCQAINGNGYTLTVTGAGATWSCAIYTNGGLIKNLTVAGAMRGIFTAGQSSDLHIDNVVFKNVIYTFNSDGKMPAQPFGVYISNSTVNGWTSHSDMHSEVVYTNCSFGEGSGYKFCRPYGKTSFINCTFSAGYVVDESKTNEITFSGCTFE